MFVTLPPNSNCPIGSSSDRDYAAQSRLGAIAARLAFACIVVALTVSPSALAAEPSAADAATFPEKVIPFYDDAPKDAALFEFRNNLLKAVRAKDLVALLDALDPAILNGYDGDEGIESFKKKWNLNRNPDASPVWKELGEALRLGGKLNKGDNETYFIAPYSYYALPDEFDETEYGLVVGEGVNVRAKPDEYADAVAKVDRIVVRMYYEEKPKEATIGNETFPWRTVGLPNGSVGYIWGKYVRSPIDYRAGFTNQSGKWKMNYFLSGD